MVAINTGLPQRLWRVPTVRTPVATVTSPVRLSVSVSMVAVLYVTYFKCPILGKPQDPSFILISMTDQ